MTAINHQTGRRFRSRYLLGDSLIPERPSGHGQTAGTVTPITLRQRARRIAIRVGLPLAIPFAAADPGPWVTTGSAVGAIFGTRAAIRTGRKLRHRRHRAMYVRPLARLLGPALGESATDPDGWLHVSPELAGLAARLVRPMSPAEQALRRWYGLRISPVLMAGPDRAMRAYWWLHEHTGTLRKGIDWFRVPEEAQPARVTVTARAGYVSREQRQMIREAVGAKLGLSDLIESWDQVGPTATATFTVRQRPPASVGLEDIADALEGLGESEFVAGLTTGRRPVILSLDDDAPHIACSAGSGAGKSVLAKLIGAQVLRKGGEVIILDRKGSHRWAMGLAGVRYLTKAEDMHHALTELSNLADERNDQALREEEGWCPGQRKFVIFEEMNATVAQLAQWWEDNRPKGAPKTSAAIVAFRNVMFMGRSAWVNLFGVAQMLTARTTNGPEARENFGIRCLSRYTVNAWKMLVPEVPMPRKSAVRGRWQIVIAGEATETQVAYLTDEQARQLANVPVSPHSDNPHHQAKQTGTVADGDRFITLRQFCEMRGISYEAAKKARSRARARGAGPCVRAQHGRAELYDATELETWITDAPTNVEA